MAPRCSYWVSPAQNKPLKHSPYWFFHFNGPFPLCLSQLPRWWRCLCSRSRHCSPPCKIMVLQMSCCMLCSSKMWVGNLQSKSFTVWFVVALVDFFNCLNNLYYTYLVNIRIHKKAQIRISLFVIFTAIFFYWWRHQFCSLALHFPMNCFSFLGSCYSGSFGFSPQCVQCAVPQCPRPTFICSVPAFWASLQSAFVTWLLTCYAAAAELRSIRWVWDTLSLSQWNWDRICCSSESCPDLN